MRAVLSVCVSTATLIACPHGAPPTTPAMVGPLDRERIEQRLPDWRQEREASRPDPRASQALATVPPGADVVVYLGTWCSDSRREVARLWRALDAAGGPLPFSIEWVGVDRDKQAPAALLRDGELERVPTFVVHRGGREVGRIVETAPSGIERELLDLLRRDAPASASP